MSLHSMTAFARAEHHTPLGSFICELKSVNHRHLEYSINLNDPLRPYEMEIREQLRSNLIRGKIDCWMRFQPHSGKGNESLLNADTLNSLRMMHTELNEAFAPHSFQISLTDVLNWPQLLKQPSIQDNAMHSEVQTIVQMALEELKTTRAREGLALHALIQERLHQLNIELDRISQRAPIVLAQFKTRLTQKLDEYKAILQPDRLEQEFVLLTHKLDIHEEMDRLRTHLNEMERVCKTGGSVGRRCDFLLQELNREVNTIASKSQDTVIAHTCVEMKVMIEQIREQIQNIE